MSIIIGLFLSFNCNLALKNCKTFEGIEPKLLSFMPSKKCQRVVIKKNPIDKPKRLTLICIKISSAFFSHKCCLLDHTFNQKESALNSFAKASSVGEKKINFVSTINDFRAILLGFIAVVAVKFLKCSTSAKLSFCSNLFQVDVDKKK